jgi:hypothetical protein
VISDRLKRSVGFRGWVLAISLLAVLPGVGQTGKTDADFDAAYRAAEAARKRAAAVGYEWTTIRSLLKAAKKAAGQGDLDRAVELAEEARLHGELAVEQAAYEDEHWVNAVPRLPEKTSQ